MMHMLPLAVLFDLDGVITDTASIHAKSWKEVFDQVIAAEDDTLEPFDESADYLKYVDGKKRLTGIEDFLRSRGIDLDIGKKEDITIETIHGIGNIKNTVFCDKLEIEGVTIFEDALRAIDTLRLLGSDIGLASSSKNARLILEKVLLSNCFKSILDGVVAEQNGVASKPDPDFYRYAAHLLGRNTNDCIVIEDAISGVVSAKQAGAGLVIGISRDGDGQALSQNGADLILSTLDEIDFRLSWKLFSINKYY